MSTRNLFDLPVEILLIIIGDLPTSSQLAFGRTCNQAYTLFTKSVYSQLMHVDSGLRFAISRCHKRAVKRIIDCLLDGGSSETAICAMLFSHLKDACKKKCNFALLMLWIPTTSRYLDFAREICPLLLREAVSHSYLYGIWTFFCSQPDMDNVFMGDDQLVHHLARGTYKFKRIIGFLEAIREKGSNKLTTRNAQGHLPLQIAFENNNAKVFAWLLPFSNPNAEAKEGKPFWFTAIRTWQGMGYKMTSAITALLQDTRIDLSEDGIHIVPCLLGYKEPGPLRWFLKHPTFNPTLRNAYGNTILHEASLSGRLSHLQLVCKYAQMSINEQNNDGDTALHILAKGKNPSYKHLPEENEACLQRLLATPWIDVNAVDRWPKTALARAMEYGNDSAVKLLLDAGCDRATPYTLTESHAAFVRERYAQKRRKL